MLLNLNELLYCCASFSFFVNRQITEHCYTMKHLQTVACLILCLQRKTKPIKKTKHAHLRVEPPAERSGFYRRIRKCFQVRTAAENQAEKAPKQTSWSFNGAAPCLNTGSDVSAGGCFGQVFATKYRSRELLITVSFY